MNATAPLRRAAPALAALLAGAALLPAQAQTAGPAALRTTVTPAGLMLELPHPSPAATAATAPSATAVVSTAQGPMRVLAEPAGTARPSGTVATPAAGPAPQQQVRHGVQVLVLAEPAAAPAATAPAATAIVEIDPARAGTRPQDTPQPNVLYRPKAAAPASR